MSNNQPEKFEKPNQETQEAMQSALNFDFSEMRTYRLPEDDEGMDNTNQILTRMPKSLLDSLNGVTEDNPEGTHKLIHVRLPISLIDKLTVHGQSLDNKRGYQTLIQDILEEYSKTHNL